MTGKIVSINISDKKGIKKTPVNEADVREDFGIEGDVHSSSEWHRQVSLLAIESIRKMQVKGLKVDVGDFAENITTEDLDLLSLPIGTRLKMGNDVIGEVSQIGKKCHTGCEVFKQTGDCIMPKEGIFIRIFRGGKIKVGDKIQVFFKEPLESVENFLKD